MIPSNYNGEVMNRFLPIALIAAAYLLGSIPFSYLVGRILAGADIRSLGSKNVGATNVMRNFGKWPGILALILDMTKGWLTIWIAACVVNSPLWPLPLSYDGQGAATLSPAFWRGLAGLVAVIGHMFPIWLHFHGGKGVATATGVFLALDPIALLVGVLAFFFTIFTTRFVSLSSIVAAASIPLAMRFLTQPPFWTVIFSVLIAIVVITKHHPNIARLAQGTERRLGRSKDKD